MNLLTYYFTMDDKAVKKWT